LYSFVEDFRRDTKSATEVRRAVFSNGWVLAGQEWKPLLTARFTASNSATEARDTIDAGVAEGKFYLQTGGETKKTRELNGKIDRPAGDAKAPEVPGE
jgi:hypothetical protein